MGAERIPPHSIQAESSVLGGFLLDNAAWDRVSDLLQESDFYRFEHRMVFGAIAALRNAAKPADVITVFEQLQSQGKAEEVGGLDYLNALAQYVPIARNIRSYAETVRSDSLRRRKIADNEANTAAAFDKSVPLATVLDTSAALALCEAATPRSSTHAAFHALDVHQLAQMQFKQREVFLAPWLHSQDLCMVFAARGIGKTHFGLAIAYALATAGKFAKWEAPKPRRVLYLDGELPGVVMQQRLLMHCGAVEPEPGFLRIFTPDLLPDGHALPDLSTCEGQAAIDALIEPETEVVFIDNLSAWARSGRENEAESWLPIAEWILRLRRRGIAVVLIHHAGKGGQQRGTSKREDLLDVVIGLSRPKDYDPSQGAVFVTEFTKARNLAGTDAESIELALSGTEEQAVWTWRTVESSTYDRVVKLTKEGLSPSEVCNELEINKSNVSRALRKARDLGDLPPEAKK